MSAKKFRPAVISQVLRTKLPRSVQSGLNLTALPRVLKYLRLSSHCLEAPWLVEVDKFSDFGVPTGKRILELEGNCCILADCEVLTSYQPGVGTLSSRPMEGKGCGE